MRHRRPVLARLLHLLCRRSVRGAGAENENCRDFNVTDCPALLPLAYNLRRRSTNPTSHRFRLCKDSDCAINPQTNIVRQSGSILMRVPELESQISCPFR